MTAYLLWLVYVSVLGFGAAYAWASAADPSGFSTELVFPTATFFSLGVVSTVGFIPSTAESTAAQVMVATQVATGPLILAWLVTEVVPHRTARPVASPSHSAPEEAGSTHVLVAALLVDDANRFLLAHRRPGLSFRPDTWDLVGGHVEPGEDPRTAVAREVYEEIGVKLGELPDAPHARWIENGYDLRIWVVRGWSGRPRNFAKGQHRDVRFFTATEARDLKVGDSKYFALFDELANDGNESASSLV